MAKIEKSYPNLSLEEAKELLNTSSDEVIQRRKDQLKHLENTVLCREMLETYQDEAQRTQLVLSDTQQNLMLSQQDLFYTQTRLVETRNELQSLKENYELARAHYTYSEKLIKEKDEFIKQRELETKREKENTDKIILYLRNSLQAHKAVEVCLRREKDAQLQQAFLLPCQNLNVSVGEPIYRDHIPHWLVKRYPGIGSGRVPLSLFELYILSEFLCEELMHSPEIYLRKVRERHIVLSMTTEKRYIFMDAAQEYAEKRVKK